MEKSPVPMQMSAYVEQALLTAILDGTYPPGTPLPNERELAVQLQVTRPTLREALQRLARDGWLTIQHGKSTLVNDYWHEGGLQVLSAMVQYHPHLSSQFVTHLLEVRLALAPAYTRAAFEHDVQAVTSCLQDARVLPDTPEAFAAFDWKLHRTLAMASSNPVYPLLLNSFAGFYERLALLYFAGMGAREKSRAFYLALLAAAQQANAHEAEQLTAATMSESLALWHLSLTQQTLDASPEGQVGRPGSDTTGGTL